MVNIEKEVTFSYLEKRFLQDVNQANRAKGIKDANAICKNYRHEGEFFDEIMDRAKEV